MIKKITLTMIFLITALCVNVWAEKEMSNEELYQFIKQQADVINSLQGTVKQLSNRVAELEGAPPQDNMATAIPSPTTNRVSLDDEELTSLPVTGVDGEQKQFPIWEWGGYIDMGYVDSDKDGSTGSSSTQINSRGDSIASAGLDGDSTFLVNEINLNLNAHVSEKMDVVTSFDIIPRDIAFTTGGATASTDNVELDTAYIAYTPDFKSSPLVDALFENLVLFAGKFDSPVGIEYRYNNSPDRVNISRSHQSVYTTGYPVGLKARGNLFYKDLREFRNSIFTYNFVVANADPFLSRSGDGDRDDNNERTVMGRLSYGLDVLDGFLETGLSFTHGARISQTDTSVDTDSFNGDMRFERGPLTLRAEWDWADEDRPPGGTAVEFKGLFAEAFYEFGRPEWLPEWIPLTSLTPYYRYDIRDFVATNNAGAETFTIHVQRQTLALRYIMQPANILKFEYQFNREPKRTELRDDLFLMSFVRRF